MSNPLLQAFPNFVELFKQLQAEYDRTPGWRWIRQAQLLHRMHKVNTNYSRWFDAWLESHK